MEVSDDSSAMPRMGSSLIAACVERMSNSLRTNSLQVVRLAMQEPSSNSLNHSSVSLAVSLDSMQTRLNNAKESGGVFNHVEPSPHLRKLLCRFGIGQQGKVS